MQVCSYCRKENPDDAYHCNGCGTKLTPRIATEPDPVPPKQELIDSPINPERALIGSPDVLDQLDLGFEFGEGFSRPDWKAIHAFVKDNFIKDDWNAVWNIIAERWLAQLARDLGGNAGVYKSARCICLSDLETKTTRTLLAYAESAIETIRTTLKGAAWRDFHGKHVLLFFSDLDDYFAYISFYYPDGRHNLSAGVFLRQGYAHVAMPYIKFGAEPTLVHELVHNLVCHLPIPLWLNEGLAVVVANQVMRRAFRVDQLLVEKHAGHWNEENIQAFWAGKSFKIPGQTSELSYSLGHILVRLLGEKGDDFITFIMNAHWRDAGQDAAAGILGCDLGEVAGRFLGPGNWRPRRKAIAEILAKKAG